MSDIELRELERQPKTPENARKLAHAMCRAGQHSYRLKYRGHDWSGSDLAQHLGIVTLQGTPALIYWPNHITTWCGEKECFFCGKTIRILNIHNTKTQESTRYEFDL